MKAVDLGIFATINDDISFCDERFWFRSTFLQQRACKGLGVFGALCDRNLETIHIHVIGTFENIIDSRSPVLMEAAPIFFSV